VSWHLPLVCPESVKYRYRMLLLATNWPVTVPAWDREMRATAQLQDRYQTMMWEWPDRDLTVTSLWHYCELTVTSLWPDRAQTITVPERTLSTTPLANYMQQIPFNGLPFLSGSTKLTAFKTRLLFNTFSQTATSPTHNQITPIHNLHNKSL